MSVPSYLRRCNVIGVNDQNRENCQQCQVSMYIEASRLLAHNSSANPKIGRLVIITMSRALQPQTRGEFCITNSPNPLVLLTNLASSYALQSHRPIPTAQPMSLSTTVLSSLRPVFRSPTTRPSAPRTIKRLFLFTRARQASFSSTQPSRVVAHRDPFHPSSSRIPSSSSPSPLLAPFSTASTTPLLRAAAAAPSSSKPMAAETDAQAAAVANQTGVTPESIESSLKEKLQAELVVVEDVSGKSSFFFLLSFFLSILLRLAFALLCFIRVKERADGQPLGRGI